MLNENIYVYILLIIMYKIQTGHKETKWKEDKIIDSVNSLQLTFKCFFYY